MLGAASAVSARCGRCWASSRASTLLTRSSASTDVELRTALLELPLLDREAVVLAAWFDLTSADAARALGITPAAYRMRVARARRRLRAGLSNADTLENAQWQTS